MQSLETARALETSPANDCLIYISILNYLYLVYTEAMTLFLLMSYPKAKLRIFFRCGAVLVKE